MKIYLTLTTPYGRLVRVALIERGLSEQVERVVVKARVPDCPVNDLNPTGKVPTLETKGGFYLSEARLICQYLDSLHTETPIVDTDPPLELRQLEGVVTGFLDGISVSVREIRRPPADRSASILEQERARVARCLPWLEARIGAVESASRFVQLALFVALEFLDQAPDIGDWSESHPRLGTWYQACLATPSIVQMKAQA